MFMKLITDCCRTESVTTSDLLRLLKHKLVHVFKSSTMSLQQPTKPSLLTARRVAEPIAVIGVEYIKYVSRCALALFRSPQTESAGPAQPNAMITGCDTGIGKEVALKLAAEGWRVFAGVFTEDGKRLGASSHNIITVPLDVTKPDSVAAAAEQVAAAVGSNGLQLLVNNAGVGLLAPAECVTLDEYKRVFDVNVFGIVSATQAFLPLLRAGQRKGRIINMSSMAGHMGFPYWGAYCGSKFAVEGLTECLRFELAPQGIHVSMVKPGVVKTPLWDTMGDKHDRLPRVLKTPQMMELYGDHFHKMLEEADQAGQQGVPVTAVVSTIVTAATSAAPKGRYYVGPNSRAFHWLKRVLLDEVWFAAVYKLTFGTGTDKKAAADGEDSAPAGPLLHAKAM